MFRIIFWMCVGAFIFNSWQTNPNFRASVGGTAQAIADGVVDTLDKKEAE